MMMRNQTNRESAAGIDATAPRRRRRVRGGLSLIELMIALAITAMLLTATMAALDASFRAYADAAEQASTQIATRMIVDRTLTLIRTSTAHGPLEPDPGAVPPITLDSDNIITSSFIELLDPNGDVLRIEYRAASNELWLILDPDGASPIAQPLMGGVTQAQFFSRRRRNRDNLWVLERCTIDLTIQPDEDTTLALENGRAQPIRVIASTAPRKLAE